jgi:hypothetical protein
LSIRIKRCLAGLLGLVLMHACAPLRVAPPVPPYSPQEIMGRLNLIEEQQRRVESFFSSGRLTLRRFPGRTQTNLLIAGRSVPSEFKIELTHGWGQPLLHALVIGDRIQIVSFTEQKLYSGRFGDPGLARFLPGLLGPEEAASILRGFPALLPYQRAVALESNQIGLLGPLNETVQVIEFHPESQLPAQVYFPLQEVRIFFSDFQEENGILYARSIQMRDAETGITAEIQIHQMGFNRDLPDDLFQLAAPAAFEELPIE